jgi:lipoate-protein ligase A
LDEGREFVLWPWIHLLLVARMNLLKLTLSTPAENLALDEALLDMVDAAEIDHDIVRLWEPTRPFVVVGRASKVAQEVNLAICHAREIPVLRRCSGGAAIVTAPGCLMYSLVISLARRPELRTIDFAHAHVLQRMRAALRAIGCQVEIQGTSDLAIERRKVSGNSLRRKRNAILYHGTLLYRSPLDLFAQCLLSPPRQPEYRANRTHREFMTNLDVEREQLEDAVASAWQPRCEWTDWPRPSVDRLTRERYSLDEWNYRH